MREYWEDRYAKQGRKTVGNCSFSENEFAQRTRLAEILVRSTLTPIFQGRRVLDFGCGYGRMTKLLVEFCPFVIGVDIVEWAIGEARTYVPKAQFFCVDEPSRLPFVAGNFEGILSWTVLQHVEPKNVDPIVKELSRVLMPGGVLVLYENTSTRYLDKPHIWFRTPEFYGALFSGFDVVKREMIKWADGMDEDHVLMVLRKGS